MSTSELMRLRWLEGRQVIVSMRDGSRIDDCQLVSTGRHETTSVWLFADGADRFVPTADVVDVQEYVRKAG
jgi:hypothetical protein